MAKRLREDATNGTRATGRAAGICPVCRGPIEVEMDPRHPDRSLHRVICLRCHAEYGTAGAPLRPW